MDQALITEEVQKLLAKQAIKEAQPFSQQFYFPTLPGGKEREWAETTGQSEGSEHFCTLRALQDGRPPHSPGPDSDQGLYDQARSERCISSNSNPSGSPTSPSISVGGENISILIPSFRADLSSKSVYQGVQAPGWNNTADGDSVSNLPGRYPYPPSGQGGSRVPSPSNLQSFQSTGFGDQYQETFTNSQQITEFLGFLINSVTLQIQMPQEKLRKIQQDARWLLQHRSVPVRDLARFVGKTTASYKAIWQAPLHYRGIQALLNSVSPDTEDNSALTGRFNVRLPLSEEALQDLLWWVSLDRTVPLQAPLLPRVPSMIITSDASTMGWGACLRDMVSIGDDAPHQLF